MKSKSNVTWAQANQAYLATEFALLRHKLGITKESPGDDAIKNIRNAMEAPSAIDTLSQLYELTTFEREILLLCAGAEMDSVLASHFAAKRPAITFGLCMEVLVDPHWSALTPDRPLRRSRLIEMEPDRGLTAAPLRIDERILHYLAGVNALDPRLKPLIHTEPHPSWIAEEHQALATEIADTYREELWQPMFLHFCGDDPRGQQDVAAIAAEQIECYLYILRAEDIPAAGPDLDQFTMLWEREAPLLRGVLLIACGDGGLSAAGRQVVERIQAPLMLSSRETLRFHRPSRRFEVNKPQPAGQKRLWQRALGTEASKLEPMLDNLAEQFRLSAETIFSVGGEETSTDPDQLWNRCRALSRPRLEDLAQRIVPSADWDDLVLPALQKTTLRQLAAQVRHRMQVYETWGFSAKGRRGLGISALFAGPSGTGKTLASEVLARELRLDLYRIDLSAVVSKYIGETEKNLKQLFDAAEESGVILLFDEADALFGKRAEVKDSHDRYANIEVSYLLQRMENYQGLAILTTNLRSSMDKAFQRRLRFIVDFPFPDGEQRRAIWSAVFPPQTPAGSLDPARLAQLNMTGGSIRNIALNAAFPGGRIRPGSPDGARAAGHAMGSGEGGTPDFGDGNPGVGMSIHVNIDRLTLGGLDPAERRAFVESFQSELSRLLANPATRAGWKNGRRTPVLRLGRVPRQPGVSGARNLARQVARAIVGGRRP